MQAFTAEKTELLATYGADANRGLTEAQARKNKEQYNIQPFYLLRNGCEMQDWSYVEMIVVVERYWP